jgi:homoserine kinase
MDIIYRVSARPILVRVPATVGNFGGMESGAALALDPSMNVKVTPRSDGRARIRYFGEDGDRVPRDSSNLILQAMRAALGARQKELAGADLEVYSGIPVCAGLGASAAAVWAGLIAANCLFALDLDEKLLFALAAALEPRRDNLHAAWLGGLTVWAGARGSYRTVLLPEGFRLSVVIPSAWREAVKPCAPLSSGNGDNHAARFDRAAALARFFEQGARAGLSRPNPFIPHELTTALPGLEEVLRVSAPGLVGMFLCGSGPAVGVISEACSWHASDAAQRYFAARGISSRVLEVRVSGSGARDWNFMAPLTRRADAGPVAALAATASH